MMMDVHTCGIILMIDGAIIIIFIWMGIIEKRDGEVSLIK